MRLRTFLLAIWSLGGVYSSLLLIFLLIVFHFHISLCFIYLDTSSISDTCIRNFLNIYLLGISFLIFSCGKQKHLHLNVMQLDNFSLDGSFFQFDVQEIFPYCRDIRFFPLISLRNFTLYTCELGQSYI